MKRRNLARALVWAGTLVGCVAVLSTSACGTPTVSHTVTRPSPTTPAPPTVTPTPVPMTIVLTSPAFKPGAPIPSEYTCDGANMSPPLTWSHAPQQTVTFVLLMVDISGTTYIHWVLFNLPAGTRELPANIPPGAQVSSGARQGINDARVIGYRGPCPALPRGTTDDYVFTLYALDIALPLDGGATKAQVLDAARGHILAQGQMDGIYKLQNS